jgi:hypothetical protein
VVAEIATQLTRSQTLHVLTGVILCGRNPSEYPKHQHKQSSGNDEQEPATIGMPQIVLRTRREISNEQHETDHWNEYGKNHQITASPYQVIARLTHTAKLAAAYIRLQQAIAPMYRNT